MSNSCSFYMVKKRTPANSADSLKFKLPLEVVWKKPIYFSPASRFQYRDDLLIINNRNNRLFIFEPSSGKVILRKKVEKGHDYGVSLDDNYLYYTDIRLKKPKLHRINLRKILFGHSRKPAVSGIFPVLIYDDQLIVTGEKGKILGFDKKSLEKIWSFEIHGGIDLPVILKGNLLYALGRKGQVVIFNLLKKQIEKKKDFKYYFNLFSDGGSGFFMGTSDGLLVKITDDLSVEWEAGLEGRLKYCPIQIKNVIYVLTMSNKLYLLSEDGGIKDIIDLDSAPGCNPILVNDYIIWGDLDHRLNVLDIKKNKIIWSKEFPGRIRTDPLWSGKYLFIGCEDKYVYALAPSGKLTEE